MVAAVMLIAGGYWYRVQAARYVSYSESFPIPPGTLARLPLHIKNWIGKDVSMSQNLIEATDTDDCVSRTYRRSGGGETVSLFVGYGIHLRDLAPHRPEVCYPGAGWTLMEKEVARITTSDGSDLPCQIYRFRQGGLAHQQIVVLSYYIIDGEYWSDVGRLRKLAAQSEVKSHYVAQVQMNCLVLPVLQDSKKLVSEFAHDAAPIILQHIKDAVTSTRIPIDSGEFMTSPKTSEHYRFLGVTAGRAVQREDFPYRPVSRSPPHFFLYTN
ncbi:MAG: EpsI family protein, partial [Phycisphaerales bacterium]|nr:EpsI family protein [Phycisphaerales bacterium]